MERIKPPRRPHPEDLDVTAVSGADVRRLFDACETWTELLCLSTLAYLGPRRRAASNLRRRDVDIERGTIRFREKGGKVITKPIPEEFAELLREAVRLGVIATDADSYVIPMARGQRRDGDRDDRLIWRTIKKLGERAGVEVHPHSLRAAFAVKFLETHPGEVEALQRLMGHSKMETTQIYLRRLDRERAMERVRDLSWGSPFASIAVEARTGFEPVEGSAPIARAPAERQTRAASPHCRSTPARRMARAKRERAGSRRRAQPAHLVSRPAD
jgi:integrase